jgi:hypothetical protein
MNAYPPRFVSVWCGLGAMRQLLHPVVFADGIPQSNDTERQLEEMIEEKRSAPKNRHGRLQNMST